MRNNGERLTRNYYNRMEREAAKRRQKAAEKQRREARKLAKRIEAEANRAARRLTARVFKRVIAKHNKVRARPSLENVNTGSRDKKGRIIWQGPRGGRFVRTAGGRKTTPALW